MPAESKPTAAVASPVNYCENGGYLVDSDIQLSPDPVDYDPPGLSVRGCNRLRCPNCKALVRNVPNLKFEHSFPKVNLAELYELRDLATSPLIKKQAGLRFYLCRCHYWSQSSSIATPLTDPEPEAFAASTPPWVCAGHPIAELPRKIDGVDVTPDNVGALTTQSLHGITPPGAIGTDKWGGTWAVRLYDRLAKTPWQERVVSAALACMDDPDADARARALDFFFKRQPPAGAQRALELLDGKRELFAGVPDKVSRMFQNPTLEHTLWLIAAPLVAQPGRARELARADALTSGKASAPLYFALAGGDPEWVAANIDGLAKANPNDGNLLANAIRYRFPERVPKKPVLERLKDLTQPAGAK